MYSVQELANLAGVTPKTLRYYDQIHLLKPCKVEKNGYRFYGHHEVERLHQILIYRQLGYPLKEIPLLLQQEEKDQTISFQKQLQKLQQEKASLQLIIDQLEQFIAEREGGEKMTDHARFEQFKKTALKENQEKYGKELIQKYGEDRISVSNTYFANMEVTEYQQSLEEEKQFIASILLAIEKNDPSCNEAMEGCRLHKSWLGHYWGGRVEQEAHLGLADLYCEDEGFAAYYQPHHQDFVAFFRKALIHYYR